MTVGRRIRDARKAAGLTQADLALRLGKTQATIARWERGQSEPTRALVAAVAKALGIGVQWLEGGGAPQSESTISIGPSYPVIAKGTGAMIINPARDNPVIAFQGVPGAYSNLACQEAYPSLKPLPCPSFEDAFAAVEAGTAGLAMIPIENSLGGRVADIHHLLPESSLYIIGEHFQPVHHQLLAPAGGTLEGIKEARSHPQALAQCRATLRELGIKPVARADTAGAAQEVAELGDPTIAAIGSSLAGETYKLETLRSRIEDKIGNVTRFVVMSRVRIEPDPATPRVLTSIVFTVRSVPASLYKSLGGFATNGINMVRLESYISVAEPGIARFYIEIEGHPAHKNVDRALDELQYFTTKLKILGVYTASPQRTF